MSEPAYTYSTPQKATCTDCGLEVVIESNYCCVIWRCSDCIIKRNRASADEQR